MLFISKRALVQTTEFSWLFCLRVVVSNYILALCTSQLGSASFWSLIALYWSFRTWLLLYLCNIMELTLRRYSLFRKGKRSFSGILLQIFLSDIWTPHCWEKYFLKKIQALSYSHAKWIIANVMHIIFRVTGIKFTFEESGLIPRDLWHLSYLSIIEIVYDISEKTTAEPFFFSKMSVVLLMLQFFFVFSGYSSFSWLRKMAMILPCDRINFLVSFGS